MTIYTGQRSGFVNPNFHYESEIKLDIIEEKLDIINELFEDKCVGFVEDSAQNNFLDEKMQKFSCESLRRLCKDLQEIFKGYTDRVRANLLQKFLDADECDWPNLLEKERRWRYLLKNCFPAEAEKVAEII